MLNTERIHTMIRLNRFEEGPARKYIKLNEMYRSDYIGMALLKNFFCVTIGYILILVVYVFYHLEFLMEQWFKMNLIGLVWDFLIGYLIVLAIYSVIVYIICTMRYRKMKKYVKAYDKELKKLEEQYIQNARRENE